MTETEREREGGREREKDDNVVGGYKGNEFRGGPGVVDGGHGGSHCSC